MKKLHFAIVLGIISVMAITKNVEAQSTDLLAHEMVSQKSISNTFGQPVYENGHYMNGGKVNERALKDIKKRYKISGEKWTNSNDVIAASFKVNNTHYSVYYDKKGHWTGSIKTYPENLLDKEFRSMVKSKYYDFQISGIQEIEYIGYKLPTYIVILQNKDTVKWIRINHGSMNVYKEF